MMTRILSAMVWLLPLGLCGCPSEESCFATLSPTPVLPIALLVVGEPVEMTLYPFDSGGCAPVGVSPESLTAEISGPDGQPVPNEGSLNLPHSGTGTLRFTPEKPGRHHFSAVFEPVGGLQQFDLHVARDRSSEAALTSLTGACHTLATPDELLVLYPQSLERITFDGTALVSTGRTAWAGAPGPVNGYGLQGLLLRTGPWLALVSQAPAQGLQACAYQVDAAGMVRTGEPCQLLSGKLLGFESSVLWMGDMGPDTQDVETLRRMEWTGSRLETRGSLLVGPSLRFIPSPLRVDNEDPPGSPRTSLVRPAVRASRAEGSAPLERGAGRPTADPSSRRA